MAAPLVKTSLLITATGATSISVAAANYNAAVATAITTALNVSGVNTQSVVVVNNAPLWDSTNYNFTGNIQYTANG